MRDGQLWLIAADGGEPRALTKHATHAERAAVVARRHRRLLHRRRSADRRRIASARACATTSSGSTRPTSTASSGRSSSRPAPRRDDHRRLDGQELQPLGRRQADGGAARADAGRHGRLARRSVGDGRERRERARADQQRVEEKSLEMSPDGSQILFIADTNERLESYYPTNLFVVPTAGRRAAARRAGLPVTRSTMRCGRRTASRSSPTSTWACTPSSSASTSAAARRQLTNGDHSIPPGWSAVPRRRASSSSRSTSRRASATCGRCR